MKRARIVEADVRADRCDRIRRIGQPLDRDIAPQFVLERLERKHSLDSLITKPMLETKMIVVTGAREAVGHAVCEMLIERSCQATALAPNFLLPLLA